MIVRRLAARRLVRTGSTEEEPPRKRAARFLIIILVAGTLAGVASYLGVWPFANVQTLVKQTFGGGKPQIAAKTIFPPVQPVHKVVNVYDPAPAPQPTAAPTTPPPKATPRATPRATPSASPRGSPPPD